MGRLAWKRRTVFQRSKIFRFHVGLFPGALGGLNEINSFIPTSIISAERLTPPRCHSSRLGRGADFSERKDSRFSASILRCSVHCPWCLENQGFKRPLEAPRPFLRMRVWPWYNRLHTKLKQTWCQTRSRQLESRIARRIVATCVFRGIAGGKP